MGKVDVKRIEKELLEKILADCKNCNKPDFINCKYKQYIDKCIQDRQLKLDEDLEIYSI